MSAVVHARVTEQLMRLRLRYVAERLDAVLNDAARAEPTYLDFLDTVLRQEVDAKQRTRIAMGLKIAHFPTVKTLDEFEFKFQPSVDQRLVRELATGRFLAPADNVLLFGAPGVGKTHLAIALGRAVVEAGHSVLFTSATALLAALAKAETEGQLADRLLFYSKPKLLIIDELGYLPFERRSAHLFFQLVARRYERGSMLITTNQVVTQWGTVFGDEVLAAAILDRLLHHSHTLMIQGESYRLKQKRKAGLLGTAPPPSRRALAGEPARAEGRQ
jgi:DNA replication protein DnaC